MIRPGFCDLHNHTLHSDGALSPTALVDLAAGNGVTALAVTDHDTVAGLAEAQERGQELGIEVVPGIELSVDVEGRDIHLLGLFVSRPQELRDQLDSIQRERIARARRIVELLAGLGCPVDYAQVQARARGGVLGRPHVAEVLIAEGHASSFEEAFGRFLGKGCPAYVAKKTVDLQQGVALLRRAGAVPVLAHPGAGDAREVLMQLRPSGVLGLEVWHPKHDGPEVRSYLEFALDQGLVPTGGSDFHREAPGCTLPGDLRLPIGLLDAIRPLAC